MPFRRQLAHLSLVLLAVVLTTALVVSSPVAAPMMMAQDTVGSKLIIRIVGAKNSNGQVAIALFKGESGFPGDKSKAFRTLQIKIDPVTKIAEVTLPDLPRGAYAIAIFHDENLNGQLDKNLFGVPKEGYGFSNISKKAMGPPKFTDASFQLDRPEQSIEVKLLY
jgi:uncharacterized protein (DUF2141 family)